MVKEGVTITKYNGAGGDVTIPGALGGLPVNRIGVSAFSHCDSLTTISLPESLIGIGDNAFRGCVSLTNISLPESCTSFDDAAFSYCSSLTSIQFNSTKTIIVDENNWDKTIPITTTIIGYDPSTAKDYADKNGNPFQLIGVSSTLQSIAITTTPTKLNYKIGEQLDLTGLVVTGTYSGATSKAETITADNVTGFNSSVAAADQLLTITVNGNTATYKVQIFTNILLGDVDGNAKVHAYDALLALKIATGKKVGTVAEIKAADVGKSGKVEAYDALRILQFATGKITAF